MLSRTFDLRRSLVLVLAAATLVACEDENGMTPPEPLDPTTAPRAEVDRFSDDAGTLFVRSANPGLPGSGEAIDMDQAPFITAGLGPDGQRVEYYNFDVQASAPAPIYVLFRQGEDTPVQGQLNIVDVIPGDPGYNDFWQVVRVTVPSDYVANTVTSFQGIVDAGYEMSTTNTLVNCPIVPEGSTADLGGGADGLHMGWYEDQVVFYFAFDEASVQTTGSGSVPSSPIWVAFNTNPGEPDGGPASGFMTQGDSDQTHNVVATVPGDAGYSPYWEVMPYDNADFGQVHDLESAMAADGFGTAAFVNCPIVSVGDAPGDPETAPRTTVDRFSDDAGTLFRRSANAALPAAGAAVDFDQGPFTTQGLGPDGDVVRYYNFDVMPATPAPIYVLFHEGSGEPVQGQKNIVDVVPGDEGYNDVWQVVRVTVPDGYIANSATSLQDLEDAGYDMEATSTLVNCPIVPDGSVARERLGGGNTGLTQGWYKGEAVFYFNFAEAPLSTTGEGEVPTAGIFVAFNVNPDQPGGGPASGFMTEPGTSQTHNVVAAVPGDAGYSPLWAVMPYDNQSFAMVTDLASAMAAPSFGLAALVNCPIYFVEP